MKNKISIPPPLMFFSFFVLEILLDKYLPLKKIFYAPLTYFGVILVFLGIILGLSSVRLFLNMKTTLNPKASPSKLIDVGPFRYSRNPIYLSFITILSGVAIYLGSIASFLSPIFMFFALNSMIIPSEEKKLEKNFKKTYSDFKRKTAKWI